MKAGLWSRVGGNMNLAEAKSEVKRLLSGVDPAQLPALLHWIRTAGNERKCSGLKIIMMKMMMRVKYKAEKATFV